VARFVKGDVVVITFPFSDLSQSKRRPALVPFEGEDVILCQITSKSIRENYAISLDDGDFESGGLKQASNIRPNRLFTADTHIILYRVGNIKKEKLNDVVEAVIRIVTA
jgi:mRNA interferase MazF